MDNRKKGGDPIPNESFERDGAAVGDKDDTEDKEKLNWKKIIEKIEKGNRKKGKNDEQKVDLTDEQNKDKNKDKPGA